MVVSLVKISCSGDIYQEIKYANVNVVVTGKLFVALWQ